MSTKKSRNLGLDILRCIALFCVIAVHFFLNSGFYEVTVAGYSMLIMVIMRNSFMICVPLFMMLTGYLINSQETNKLYYIKIIRIIYTYSIASMICAFYRIYILRDGLSLLGSIANIFSFETAPYSWYIEMYIGLFLLIPFLNTMYAGLCTQKKQILVVTLLLLTVLPSIMNSYCIAGFEWWLMPSKASNYFPVVPDWWKNIYPITYYFLGKYLQEFSTKLNPKRIALLTVFVFFFSGIYNYYRSYGSTFVKGPWQEYGSVLVTLQTVLIFCFFTKIKYTKHIYSFRNFFATISDLSLGAYLTSWVFDQVVYTKLNASFCTIEQKLMWFPVVVTIVLIGSLLCSYFINLSYSVIFKKLISRDTNQISIK